MSGRETGPAGAGLLRMVAYNVSGGWEPGAAGAVLAGLAPDLACILESPGGRRLGALARGAGLGVAVRAGRRGTAAAVLVGERVHVRTTARLPLESSAGAPRREAAHAIVGWETARLSVTAVQLGLRPELRRTNLYELLRFLGSVPWPALIGADLNESVRSPVAGTLAERYQDAAAVARSGSELTYPTSDVSTRQDFVFVDPSLEVRRCWAPDSRAIRRASHHRPVVADVVAGAVG